MSNSNDSLNHYADPNYDPVKAHEYYLKIRELKERKNTPEPVSTPTPSPTVTAPVKKVSKKSSATKARGDNLRKKLSDKIQATSKKKALAIAERIRLEKAKQQEIDALPPIPTNISPAQKAVLIANRQKEIAKITAKYDALYNKVDESLKPTAEEKAKAKKRKANLRKLKKKIQEAREAYKEAQEKLKEKREQTLEEYEESLLLNSRKVRSTKK